MGKSLVTLAEYKGYVGITSPTYDLEISQLIPKVSELVKSYCRTSFVDNSDDPKIEYFNGGVSCLYLAESPVLEIFDVEVSDDYGQTYVALVQYVDWVYSPVTQSIVSLNPSGFRPKTNGYRVTYSCGYTQIPEDLKLAVLDLITYYRRGDAAQHSAKSAGSGSVQIEYVLTASFPAHIRRVLDLYISSLA